ncbi:MAG: hypothetical protein ACOYL6_01465 [Bacteriovoracaceae bacterium]
MKTSIKSTSKILGIFLLSSSVWAGSVGRVTAVKGHAFTISMGETKVLKVGDDLPAGADLISEEGSQVSFNDYTDHRFHLSGSGNIALKEKDFELKRGYLWVQSFNSYTKSQIKTANSITVYGKSEFIVSFDNNSGRTQILAVTGPFDFANLNERNLSRSIETGNFSFIDKDYESGMPRKGTLIGYQSYTKIVGLFDEVKPLDSSVVAVIQGQKPMNKTVKEDNFARELASLSPEIKAQKDKILGISSVKSKVQKSKRQKPSVTKVEMKIYGLQTEMMETVAPTLKSIDKRTPASLEAPVVEVQNQFEQSLKQEEMKQPRHQPEVNSLIDELKSYQSDFTKEY